MDDGIENYDILQAGNIRQNPNSISKQPRTASPNKRGQGGSTPISFEHFSKQDCQKEQSNTPEKRRRSQKIEDFLPLDRQSQQNHPYPVQVSKEEVFNRDQLAGQSFTSISISSIHQSGNLVPIVGDSTWQENSLIPQRNKFQQNNSSGVPSVKRIRENKDRRSFTQGCSDPQQFSETFQNPSTEKKNMEIAVEMAMCLSLKQENKFGVVLSDDRNIPDVESLKVPKDNGQSTQESKQFENRRLFDQQRYDSSSEVDQHTQTPLPNDNEVIQGNEVSTNLQDSLMQEHSNCPRYSHSTYLYLPPQSCNLEPQEEFKRWDLGLAQHLTRGKIQISQLSYFENTLDRYRQDFNRYVSDAISIEARITESNFTSVPQEFLTLTKAFYNFHGFFFTFTSVALKDIDEAGHLHETLNNFMSGLWQFEFLHCAAFPTDRVYEMFKLLHNYPRKRCLDRLCKNIGDLSLKMSDYHTFLENLRAKIWPVNSPV